MNQRGAVVVTGASSGIGRACALRLDRAGFRVFASVLSADEAEELKAAAPQLEPFVLDIRDATSIQNALQTVSIALEEAKLCGLVNNAGILACAPLELLHMEQVRQVFEVNVIGQIALTQAFLPLLRHGKSRDALSRSHSRIINLGSLGGRSALPFTSPYSASKFAFRALSDCWRVELKAQGIAVVLVEPGMVKTLIWQKGSERAAAMSPAPHELYPSFLSQVQQAAQLAQRSGVDPAHVAEVVLHALRTPRPKARYVLGREARLLLAIEKLPTPMRDWLIARRFLN